ncbi:nucleoside 2-deoxyribosyltransferase [Clostridium perfringens]|nr:nucleoside 2-deoxyribosyltransferase [Clostridium perfringens]
MKTCFVICPIGEDNTPTRKRSDELLKYIIEPVCQKCGFEAIRVDNIHASDAITQTILDNLKKSDLVIADLTEHNPNVFYELGYRFSLNKPLIQLKHKDDTIPFDVAGIRTINYDLSSLSASDEFKKKLEKTIKSFNYESSNKNNVKNELDNGVLSSQILQELYSLQDSIKNIDKKLSDSVDNSVAISILADKLSNNTSQKSMESSMMQTLLQAALNDPQKVHGLLELQNKFQNIK